MANSTTTTRTNYFRVKDPARFKSMMERVSTDGDEIEIWEKPDSESKSPLMAFGCYADIIGFLDKDGDMYDNSYDDFLKELQTMLQDNEACIIMSSGHCKLRSVYGLAIVVTADSIVSLDLESLAINETKRLLDNPEWSTTITY